MYRAFLSLSVILALIAGGCGGGPGAPSGAPVTPPGETLSVAINGVANSVVDCKFTVDEGGVEVLGTWTDGRTVSLSFPPPTVVPAAYTVNGDTAEATFAVMDPDNPDSEASYVGDAGKGTVVVTSFTPTSCTGTFSFGATNEDTGDVVALTAGTFVASKQTLDGNGESTDSADGISTGYLSSTTTSAAVADLWQLPLKTWTVTRDFCNYVKGLGYHCGEDGRGKHGTPVYASAAGTVKETHIIKKKGYTKKQDPASHGYGCFILIEHDGPPGYSHPKVCSLYGHLSRDGVYVKAGDKVTKGQKIGHIGTTMENGRWPVHLHFQIIQHAYGWAYQFQGYWPDESWVKDNFENPTTDSKNGIGFINRY